MDIDTLILSGGSTKGVSFLGSINYLIENDYIDKKFKNIRKIICVSASFLFVLILILLEYDFNLIEQKIYMFNFEYMLDINDLSLKNLVNDYGFINYNRTHIFIKEIIKERYGVEQISLLKLYKMSGIHIVVKVVNVSEQKVEYIDHINNPKINILKLIQMTTCIPLLLKPTKYKGNLYLDGGLSGNCPIEVNDSNNYLCIEIKSVASSGKEINNVLDYIVNGWDMYSPDILIRKYDIHNIKIDLSELCIDVHNFKMDNSLKKNILDKGYEETKRHFAYYLQQ